ALVGIEEDAVAVEALEEAAAAAYLADEAALELLGGDGEEGGELSDLVVVDPDRTGLAGAAVAAAGAAEAQTFGVPGQLAHRPLARLRRRGGRRRGSSTVSVAWPLTTALMLQLPARGR